MLVPLDGSPPTLAVSFPPTTADPPSVADIDALPLTSGPNAAEYATGTFHCDDAVVTTQRKYLPSKSPPNAEILFVVEPPHVELAHVLPPSEEYCH